MSVSKVQFDGNTLINLENDTVAANKMLSGTKAHDKNGDSITGNIASKSAATYTPTTTDQMIAAGQYLAGAQTIKGDANLVAGNIKKDVTIFGKTGTYEGSGGGGAYGGTVTITNSDSGGYGNSIRVTEFVNDFVIDPGQTITLNITAPQIALMADDLKSYSGGMTLLHNYEGYIRYFYIHGDGSITAGNWCLAGDTLILMADGTQKRLDNIELGEEILCFDFNINAFKAAKVLRTDKDAHKTHTEYDVWTFDDGTIIKTVHMHRFFNVEKNAFVYMQNWEIGQHTYKIDGTTPMLISHENVQEEVEHYTIKLDNDCTNYFANGLFTGDRYCPKDIDYHVFQGV